MEDLSTKLKNAVVTHLREKGDVPFIVTGNRGYTANQLADEVENETEMGFKTLSSLFNLTIDMVSRGKKELTV